MSNITPTVAALRAERDQEHATLAALRAQLRSAMEVVDVRNEAETLERISAKSDVKALSRKVTERREAEDHLAGVTRAVSVVEKRVEAVDAKLIAAEAQERRDATITWLAVRRDRHAAYHKQAVALAASTRKLVDAVAELLPAEVSAHFADGSDLTPQQLAEVQVAKLLAPALPSLRIAFDPHGLTLYQGGVRPFDTDVVATAAPPLAQAFDRVIERVRSGGLSAELMHSTTPTRPAPTLTVPRPAEREVFVSRFSSFRDASDGLVEIFPGSILSVASPVAAALVDARVAEYKDSPEGEIAFAEHQRARDDNRLAAGRTFDRADCIHTRFSLAQWLKAETNRLVSKANPARDAAE